MLTRAANEASSGLHWVFLFASLCLAAWLELDSFWFLVGRTVRHFWVAMGFFDLPWRH